MTIFVKIDYSVEDIFGANIDMVIGMHLAFDVAILLTFPPSFL